MRPFLLRLPAYRCRAPRGIRASHIKPGTDYRYAAAGLRRRLNNLVEVIEGSSPSRVRDYGPRPTAPVRNSGALSVISEASTRR